MSEVEVRRGQRVRDVAIRTSADAEQVALLRSFAVDVAMRMDFDLDLIEDLRVMVDEACSLLVGAAAPEAMLDCRLEPGDTALRVRLSVSAAEPTLPSADALSWQIIQTLATRVSEQVDRVEDGYRVSLDLLAGFAEVA